MKLQDNTFKTTYDTSMDDDVLRGFYTPALMSSKEYLRMAGFFSSASLAVAAEGIAGLIKNDGTMKLLTSPYLEPKDIEIMNRLDGDGSVEEYISNKIAQTLDSEKILEDHVEALGWMLANKKLEIRIVLVKDENGKALTSDEIDSSGIFHNKVGILSDDQNTVAFSGSINETYAGWKKNVETFSVFCDWEDGLKHIEPLRERFEHYWKLGESKRTYTMELSAAVKKELIRSIPLDRNDLRIFSTPKNAKTKLRKYQTDAIDNWFENGRRGIFNMATGTGKTITAVHAVKRSMSTDPKTAVIIAVPFQHLIDMWVKTIEKELTTEAFQPNFILAFDSRKKWAPEAKELVESLNFDVIDNLFIITTYDTFSSEKFAEMIASIRCKKLLIADEVHNVGAPTYMTGLREDYQYRLGLSATPARYMDEEGTTMITDYFGKEVYTFDLERAIREINPDTGQSFLTPYKYYPIFVSLNEDELIKYRELSAKITKITVNEETTPHEMAIRMMLLIKRSKIIKNASNKLKKLEEDMLKLKESGFMNYCLIYCSDGRDKESEEKTLKKVIQCLNRNSISNRRFTAGEDAEERKEIIESFGNGSTEALVAIKCLDEGVDVPATRNAIIMASTGNPREYIQRRGRVLRRSKNKEYATIFDFIIIPNEVPKDIDTELQILAREYERFVEFSKYSMNAEESNMMFEDAVKKYKRYLGGRQ